MTVYCARRSWFWILGIGLGLLVLAALLLPAIPPSVTHTTERFFCQRCGTYEWVTQVTDRGSGDLLESESRIEPTALSAWYLVHYPSPCQHVWRRNHVGSTGYRVLGPFPFPAGGSSSGGERTPSLLSLSEQDRKDLERRYAADKDACQAYISQALKGTAASP